MQQELQGTVTGRREQAPGRELRQAVQLVEQNLDELLAELPRGREQSLTNTCTLLAFCLFLVSCMILEFLRTNAFIRFEYGIGYLAYAILGSLALVGIATGLCKRAMLKAIARDDLRFPWIYKLSRLSGNPETDRQYIQRTLAAGGAGEQLIASAQQSSQGSELRGMLINLASHLSTGPQAGFVATFLRLLRSRFLPHLFLASYLLLSSFWLLGRSQIALGLLATLLLLGALAKAEADRHFFLLPEVVRYLRPVLDYYRNRDSLRAARSWYAAVPQQVSIQAGSGKLALLASQMSVDLLKRGSLLGTFVSPAYLLPFAYCLFHILLFISIMTFPDEYGYGLLVLAGLILYTFIVWQIARLVDRRARRHLQRVAELCRNRGLLQEMAMGQLPLSELRASCPLVLQHLLFRPGRPAELGGSGADHCWTLMWNTDYFCGLRPRQFRVRWHSYWLFPFLLNLLTVSVYLLGVAIFDLAINNSITHADQYKYLASILGFFLIVHFVQFRMLDLAARHMAGAWAVVLCMEELVQAGEDEVGSEP